MKLYVHQAARSLSPHFVAREFDLALEIVRRAGARPAAVKVKGLAHRADGVFFTPRIAA